MYTTTPHCTTRKGIAKQRCSHLNRLHSHSSTQVVPDRQDEYQVCSSLVLQRSLRNMTAWRQAGLNYINYSQIAARLVRQALKGEARAEAEKRGDSVVRLTHWKDGKAQNTAS